ncbi:FAD/NAD(P)-binding domain-containing protein [Dentipellis sp. KUC8613]|nr:FAD/NAD(P)-binding domain-containing protein [Dentipellis sp. KUC8613]
MVQPLRRAEYPLDFIVVGGGVSGLATACSLALSGHRVRVFEAAPTLVRRAGGVRVPPNLTRILVEWGLGPQLEAKGVKYTGYTFLDLITGQKIAFVEWRAVLIKEAGASFYMMHHQDLVQMLYDLALANGVEVHFNSPIESVSAPAPVPMRSLSQHTFSSDSRPPTPGRHSSSPAPSSRLAQPQLNGLNEHPPSSPNHAHSHHLTNGTSAGPPPAKPTIRLTSGATHSADIVVGADGYSSVVRAAVEHFPEQEIFVERTVYISVLQADRKIEEEADLRQFASGGWPMWTGTFQNAMCYPIRPGEFSMEFMLHMELPEDAEEGWDTSIPGDAIPLDGLEPRLMPSRIQVIRKQLGDSIRLRCRERPAAREWIDDSERVVLVGEAAHPVLHCGTNNCSAVVEDAAVLGRLFSRCHSPDLVAPLLYAYQEIRQSRVEVLYNFDKLNRIVSQLPPGPERDERDEKLRAGQKRDDEVFDENALAIQWAGVSEIWAYNAFDAADDWWVHWGLLRERSKMNEGRLFDGISINMTLHEEDVE